MENILSIYALISAVIILLLISLLIKNNKKIKQEKEATERKMIFLKKEIELLKLQRETWKERENVILLLDWLRTSNYHNQGFNGWAKFGHTPYAGFSSENILTEYEEKMSKPEKADY